MEGDVAMVKDAFKTVDHMKSITDLAHWPQLLCLERDFLASVSHCFVFDNGESALVITKDDRTFVYGKNVKVNLSADTSLDSERPIEVAALSGKRVVEIAETYYDIFALTENGDLYFWSQITDGAPMHILSGIVKLCIESDLGSDNGAFAIDQDGNAWVLADNWSTTENITRMAAILMKKFCDCRIVDISSNGRSVWTILTEDQNVHVISQSGKVEIDFSLDLRSNETCKSVIVYKFAEGEAHMFTLTESGQLYQLVASCSSEVSKVKIADSIEQMIKVKSQILFSNKGRQCYIFDSNSNSSGLILTSFRSLPDAISFYSRGSVILTKLPHELIRPESLRALNQFNNPLTSDLTIVIELTFGIKKIYVHQAVIKERFPALISKLNQSDKKEFKIGSTSFGSYYTYFRWLYTNVIDAQEPWIAELSDIGNWSGDLKFKFELENFLVTIPTDHMLQLYKSYCDESTLLRMKSQGRFEIKKKRYNLLSVIRARINIDTCCHIYECAFQPSGNEVMESIAQLVREKMDEVAQTDGYQQMQANIRNELLSDSRGYNRCAERYGLHAEEMASNGFDDCVDQESNASDYQSDAGAEDRLEEIEVPSDENTEDDNEENGDDLRDDIIENLDEEEEAYGSDFSHPPSEDSSDDGLDHDDLGDHMNDF